MKILLVNPNRIQQPPVIPIGLEYIGSSLLDNGHGVEILDLCFEPEPSKKLANILEKMQFDAIGFGPS
ncbi:MAG: hypothetical protein ACTSRA_23135 [Promethearchaeota archaeon]